MSAIWFKFEEAFRPFKIRMIDLKDVNDVDDIIFFLREKRREVLGQIPVENIHLLTKGFILPPDFPISQMFNGVQDPIIIKIQKKINHNLLLGQGSIYVTDEMTSEGIETKNAIESKNLCAFRYVFGKSLLELNNQCISYDMNRTCLLVESMEPSKIIIAHPFSCEEELINLSKIITGCNIYSNLKSRDEEKIFCFQFDSLKDMNESFFTIKNFKINNKDFKLRYGIDAGITEYVEDYVEQRGFVERDEGCKPSGWTFCEEKSEFQLNSLLDERQTLTQNTAECIKQDEKKHMDYILQTSGKTIVLSNLHPFVEELDIRYLLTSFGKIESLKLDSKKNMATIEFESVEQALQVSKQRELFLFGLRLNIGYYRHSPVKEKQKSEQQYPPPQQPELQYQQQPELQQYQQQPQPQQQPNPNLELEKVIVISGFSQSSKKLDPIYIKKSLSDGFKNFGSINLVEFTESDNECIALIVFHDKESAKAAVRETKIRFDGICLNIHSAANLQQLLKNKKRAPLMESPRQQHQAFNNNLRKDAGGFEASRPFQKVALCRSFLTNGFCEFGNSCNFPHSEEEALNPKMRYQALLKKKKRY